MISSCFTIGKTRQRGPTLRQTLADITKKGIHLSYNPRDSQTQTIALPLGASQLPVLQVVHVDYILDFPFAPNTRLWLYWYICVLPGLTSANIPSHSLSCWLKPKGQPRCSLHALFLAVTGTCRPRAKARWLPREGELHQQWNSLAHMRATEPDEASVPAQGL